jgi:mannose-6-phosphate isomerase-like protein (cupin superfamily)
VADTLKLTPHETLTIRRSEPEVLEVEATYGAGGSPPPAHFHPAQDEHFEVLVGRMQVKVDGEAREISAGDSLDIPRLRKHQMWNPFAEEARVLWRTSPAGRTEQWFRAVDRLIRENDGKMPGPLAFGALLTEYDDTFRLAVGPEPLMRPAVAALGALGRLRGHKA